MGRDILYSQSNGLAIRDKQSLKYEKTGAYVDQAGRTLLLEITINYKIFVIGRVYAPAQDETAFLKLFFRSFKFFTS